SYRFHASTTPELARQGTDSAAARSTKIPSQGVTSLYLSQSAGVTDGRYGKSQALCSGTAPALTDPAFNLLRKLAVQDKIKSSKFIDEIQFMN
ncbi:hypothetical protein BaRGS_00024116, partial [Batillaria attramentaria]